MLDLFPLALVKIFYLFLFILYIVVILWWTKSLFVKKNDKTKKMIIKIFAIKIHFFIIFCLSIFIIYMFTIFTCSCPLIYTFCKKRTEIYLFYSIHEKYHRPYYHSLSYILAGIFFLHKIFLYSCVLNLIKILFCN